VPLNTYPGRHSHPSVGSSLHLLGACGSAHVAGHPVTASLYFMFLLHLIAINGNTIKVRYGHK